MRAVPRPAIPALILLACLAAPASAAPITDARALHQACHALAALTAGGGKVPLDDPCRTWLVDYFTVYKEAHDARLAAMLEGGAPDPGPQPCFRPPDFVSFAEIAALVARKGDTAPGLLDGPPGALVQNAMADAYPCAAPADGGR